MATIELLFLSHLLATMLMTGIIWFVQIVHYPLFLQIGPAEFATFEANHRRLTGQVVAPLMLWELGSAFLILGIGGLTIPLWSQWVGLGLLAFIWGSTFFWQVPLHLRLDEGYDQQVIKQLVRSNWVRTWAWSMRSLLGCWWLLLLFS